MRRSVIIAVLALTACAPPVEEVRQDVEAFGFTNVVIGDWAFYGCAKDDNWGYHFTATSPSAQRQVEGVACGGILLKGATVRITGTGA